MTNSKKPTSKKPPAKQSRNEFRKYKRSGHPTYIYEKVGDEFKFLGITHSPITQGIKNIELEKSPNPNDGKKTYVKKNPEQDKTNKFKEIKKGWKFTENDKTKIDNLKK